jgi:hypothetical protein
MPINFRYSEISRDARAAGDRLLFLTRGYEDLVVPRGIGVTRLAVLGMVARARNLLRSTYSVADTGDALAAAVLVRTLTESVLTLGWLDHDPELGELIWTLDEIRTRLEHHKEVASEERRERARARRRGESVDPLPPGESLGLLTRTTVRDLHQVQAVARAKITGLSDLESRKHRLRVTKVQRMPSFAARAKVVQMPWVYSLVYRFDSNAAAHPTALALEQFLEISGDNVVIRSSPRGDRPDPYYVAAQLMMALIELAGRHVDQTELDSQLQDVKQELERLRLIVQG